MLDVLRTTFLLPLVKAKVAESSVLFVHGFCSLCYVVGEDKVPETVATSWLRVYSVMPRLYRIPLREISGPNRFHNFGYGNCG